jgi:hypothetical protein
VGGPLRSWACIACATWLFAAAPADARPDLASRRTVDSLLVFADDARSGLWYYAPPPLRIATRADGAPDVSLLAMRYTGNARSGDRGLVLHRSLLSLRVELPAVGHGQLERCAQVLGAGVALEPLPIRRVEAALVYVTIGGAVDSTHALAGRLQADGSADPGDRDSYWNERVFTVALDSLTVQALEAGLRAGQLVLSLGFAYVADGRAAVEPWRFDGPRELVDSLAAQVQQGAGADSAVRRVVTAGAIPVHVEAQRWPDRIRHVDVDGASPSGFVSTEVYCYDFHDGRRPDLYEKQVEVEAEAAGGAPVRLHAVFARAHPDVYSARLTFPVAVRLDRPYRYRVAEIRPDGSTSAGSWRTGRDWVGLLDLTTPAARTAPGVRPIR